jgi:hypothetical protein
MRTVVLDLTRLGASGTGDANGGARARGGVLGVRDQVQEDLDELVLVRHGRGR